MRGAALAVSLGAAAALGCNSNGRLLAAPPHASVSPARLDFGETPVLFPVRRSLLISAAGTATVHVSNARVEDDAAGAFSIQSAPATVAAGHSAELVAIFRPPSRAAFAARLVLDTDDAEQPEVTVPLAGAGTVSAALDVRPGALDFGRVGEGQSAARELTLTSAGQADLYLAAAGPAPGTPDAFALVGSLSPPLTMPVGQRLTIAVRFSPPVGLQAGPWAVRLDSSDPRHPALDVPLLASINRAPVPIARGRLGSDAPRIGPIDAPVGAILGLDATASTDPDGDLPLRFRWTLALKPQGSAAVLADPAAPTAAVRLDAAGSYSFTLDATDAAGVPGATPARLDVRALPPEQLLIELVWDKIAPDLDLHVVQDGQERGSAGDCSWTNTDPVWFPGGPDLNPHFLGDKLTGYGPEQVAWKAPGEGRYRLDVVYKDAHEAKDASTAAQVRVYAYGQIIADLRHVFAREGDAWTAGYVDWPQARVEVAP